ncbi:MAG: hypothetical protein ACI4JC_02880 [Faecalibacterium sp.]
MKQQHLALLCGALAAALLLTGCGKRAPSGSSSSSGTNMSGSAGSSSSSSSSGAWRTGLGVTTSTAEDNRTGKITTTAAAVLLDADGKLVQVVLDELECTVSADGAGAVTMPTDYRTKRQKGSDYPLAAASGINKGWAEQADAFGKYLVGMTAEQVSMLETDADGKPKDTDLLSSCTIAVDVYRDTIAKACAQAQALGAAQGDTLSLGVEAANGSSSLTATDDQDVNAQVDITFAAVTFDSDGRVTSALCDSSEPALTVASDGGVSAPEAVRTKREQGDDYGMRTASSLGKEWYEHSDGFCDYIKGKTAAQIQGIPDDGSSADLSALCTISISDLQKAVINALDS